MENIIGKSERRYDLDWLRLLGITLFIFFHTARIFDSILSFYIKNNLPSPVLDKLVFFLDQWLLPLFFVIAGAAVNFSLNFRSSSEFLKERFKRLIIPFIFGLLVIIPPQLYYALKSSPAYKESFFSFYSSYFSNISTAYPLGGGYSGSFELGHLWFLVILFLYCLVFLPLFLFLKKEIGKRIVSKLAYFCRQPGVIFLLALPFMIVEVFFRSLRGWPFLQNPILYLVFFIYGFVMFSDNKFKEIININGRNSLFLALITTLILFSMDWQFLSSWSKNGDLYNNLGLEKHVFETVRSFNMWFWIIALLHLAQNIFDFGNKTLKYFNEAVLPFYILHQSIIVIVGFYVIKLNITLFSKYFLIVVFSSMLILSLYDLLIRRLNILRFLFGMKLLKKK